MEPENFPNSGTVKASHEEDSSAAALNSSVINYYKKFGKKSNIEQYFSLSTAHSEIRDPTSSFWKRMKAQSDSSDSIEKKSESSAELCRISIKCSIPEHSSSQEENPKSKSDSESPPIITEDVVPPIASTQSDCESVKSDEGHSPKSADATLDTSMNKPFSPTSSITSQRKLEWDSLADVGYGNESERKTSASSLSTLERLALKQQYSNNDSQQTSRLTEPTAHSTPIEQCETKSKGKKGPLKKNTRIYQKDTDFVQVNMPHTSGANQSPAINVNLTKHISFNVEKDGGVTIDKINKDLVVSPEKEPSDKGKQMKSDKEIQTSLTKKKNESVVPISSSSQPCEKGIYVLMNLNTLKNRNRRRKLKTVKKRNKLRISKKFEVNKENISVQEKSGEQVSEAESFEYMPGHIYNQNHMYDNPNQSRSINADNKSSLESSGAFTTDSSKNSRLSFTKDLERNIDLIRVALDKRSSDINLRKRLIKEMVKRLLDTKYKDDNVTGFLKEISNQNLALPEKNYTTTSTSEANNSSDKSQVKRPNKSILRRDKLNPNLPTTSQSAPNLPTTSKNENAVLPNVNKPLTSSNTESDLSSKEKSSSDNLFSKISSQELYQKYLAALRREDEYKKHLKDKETFLRQKQVSSDTAINLPPYIDATTGSRLKELMKDLTRNNYDDGSGDASKLEGGSASNFDLDKYRVIRQQRRHSVFTLSSGNSESHEKKSDLRKRIQCEIKKPYKASTSKGDDHYCCCPFHLACVKPGVTDSSVQVNLKQNDPDSLIKSNTNKKSPGQVTRIVPDDGKNELKYLCVAADNGGALQEVPENFLIYKCSRLTNRGVQLEAQSKSNAMIQCNKDCACMHKFKDSSLSHSSSSKDKDIKFARLPHKVMRSSSSDNIIELVSTKSSQTELDLFPRKSSVSSVTSCETDGKIVFSDSASKGATKNELKLHDRKKYVMQATRWVQTEISIEPKLSDPSLSDVKMINDDDCVKLISEQCNEVCKTDSKSNSSRHQQSTNGNVPNITEMSKCNINMPRHSARGEVKHKDKNLKEVYTCCDKSERVDTSTKETCMISAKKVNQGNQVSSDYNEKRNSENKPDNSKGEQTEAENFTIPIHGTNMTLKVCIGSNKPDVQTEKKNNETQICCEMISKGSGTNEIDSVDKATSLTGLCRGVQSHGTDTSCIDHGKTMQPQNEVDKEKEQIKKTPVGISANTCVASACVTKEGFKFNTYPTNVHIKERKPIIRSNTDSAMDRFMSNSNEQSYKIQTDCVKVVDVGIQNEKSMEQTKSAGISRDTTDRSQSTCSKRCSDNSSKSITKVVSEGEQVQSSKSNSDNDNFFTMNTNDAIMEMIQTITKRYSKKVSGKSDKKKCFKEIMTLLKYLLDTEDNTDQDKSRTTTESSVRDTDNYCKSNTKEKSSDLSDQNHVNFVDDKESHDSNKAGTSKLIKDENKSMCNTCEVKELVDKGVQLPLRSTKTIIFSNTDSSDVPISTDMPGTSSGSITCKVLNKIKKECEKYHQKRCKSSYGGSKKYDISSSTSVNCENCKRVHYCHCRGHKCKNSRQKVTVEKFKRDCIAYNLIIQPSDSMVSDDVCSKRPQPLQNIVVKVPKRKTVAEKDSCKSAKTKEIPTNCGSQNVTRMRSRSLPNEEDISSLNDCRRSQGFTVRDYLERNRPDFIEKTSNRQNCLRFISESRANERTVKRELLSLQLEQQPTVRAVSASELRRLARELGVELRRKRLSAEPKFISERDMKKHSERIYKSLPEVQRKKEEAKKENIKKTNLLMASIFKKNLQKKTLGGNVNLSNYSPVIKI